MMSFLNRSTFLFILAVLAPQKNSVSLTASFVINGKSQSLVGKNNNGIILKYGLSENDELHELDNARARFERLMQDQQEPSFVTEMGGLATRSYNNIQARASQPPMSKEEYVPILTESFRRRREVEIELLSTLSTSDDGIEPLIQFWVKERDHESAAKMKEMEQFCTSTHVVEERFFREAISKYGYDWVEPMSRLALLLLVDGRYSECEYWCRVALAVKPWHFEVIQILIMSATRQNNPEKIRYWTGMALPPLEESEKRRVWVNQALRDANDSMERAQKAKRAAVKKAQERSAEEQINRWESSSSSSTFYFNSEDAWQ